MQGYTKLQEMLQNALAQAGEEAGMLLGQDLIATLTDSLAFSKTAYFGDLDDGVFVLEVESREEYPGLLYLVFNLRDAILMSSLLLGIPLPRIKEKQRLSIIEADDIDAFGEIGNMVNGALNTVFQDSLSGKAHLKLLGSKKYVPEIDTLSSDEPLPDGDYLLFRSRLEMEGQEMHHLDVLIPEELGKLYDPSAAEESAEEQQAAADQDEQTEAAAESEADSENVAEAGTVGEDAILLFEDDDVDRHQMSESLKFTNFKIIESALDADLKDLFTQGNIRLVVIGSNDATDREFAVCIKINAMRQNQPVPIVMAAERWTRKSVLKALKYGARQIIIKPIEQDELAGKVRKICRISST